MGFSFRKTLRLLPGVRVSLSKSGPRLSVGVPGARASIDLKGKARLYGGMGPLRYQKSGTVDTVAPQRIQGTLRSLVRKIFKSR